MKIICNLYQSQYATKHMQFWFHIKKHENSFSLIYEETTLNKLVN